MRTAQQMIDREVLVCLSGLVSTLAQGYGHSRDSRDLSDLTEQAFELASPILDYEEAAREAGWECVEREGFPEGTQFEDTTDGMKWPCSGWEQLCADHDIEPHEREVFEHWAVTDWFAEKLEAAGEKVDRDFAGMCVWARTATGQAIYMDAVIKRIHADCAKPVEG